MFKIVHGLSRCTCPKFVNQQLARLDILHEELITSGCHDVELPIFKNNPSSIRHWNSLDYNLRNLNSLALFKRRIKDEFGYKRSPPYYYLWAASIWHTRLRLGMSQLSLMRLPPDNDSLNLHKLRADHLAYIQRHAELRNHPSPIGHGWKMMNGHHRLVRYTKGDLPAVLSPHPT